VGDLAVRLLVTWSALCVVKSLPKRLPNGLGAAEAKAAALHPKWYQSLLSLKTVREAGTRPMSTGTQADRAAS